MDGQNFDNNNFEVKETNYQDNTTSYQEQPVAPAVEPAAAPGQSNGLAVVSLVLGIAAILLGCCMGWVGCLLGIGGIICAVFANKQGKSGMAKAGLICSILGIVFGLLITVFSVIFVAAFADMADSLGMYY